MADEIRDGIDELVREGKLAEVSVDGKGRSKYAVTELGVEQWEFAKFGRALTPEERKKYHAELMAILIREMGFPPGTDPKEVWKSVLAEADEIELREALEDAEKGQEKT